MHTNNNVIDFRFFFYYAQRLEKNKTTHIYLFIALLGKSGELPCAAIGTFSKVTGRSTIPAVDEIKLPPLK